MTPARGLPWRRRQAPAVTIVHWNPERPDLTSSKPKRARDDRVGNFGDMVGPALVKRILREKGIREKPAAEDSPRLLTVGSILHFAEDGDVVWGAGANGKMLDADYPASLDIRSVRGPLSRDFLIQRGFAVPEIYGDPALLVNRFWNVDRLRRRMRPRKVTLIPNLHDYHRFSHLTDMVVNPRERLEFCLAAIAASDLVVGSSLHGIIVAESFGVPARLIRPEVEPPFKYEDHYFGSGRQSFAMADSVEHAIALGGEAPPVFDGDRLLGAFPLDMWA